MSDLKGEMMIESPSISDSASFVDDIVFSEHVIKLSPDISATGAKNRLHHTNTIKTIVAMPAYNEEARIADIIAGAKLYVNCVLVVDDGSCDNTASIASSLDAMVVRHEVNKGYGKALQTIFSIARDLDVDELIIIDSDGQHDSNDIPRLLAELRNGNDVVIGSRFNGVKGEGIPLYRKIGMKVLDIATCLAGNGLEISDSQSGFRAYGKKAIDVIHIGEEGMSAGSEILVQISDYNLKVAEVPIRVRYDLGDTSSENPILHGVRVLVSILKLIILRRPLPFFGIPGGLLILLGLCAGVCAFSGFYLSEQFYPIIFTGGFALLMPGLILVTLGVILNLLMTVMNNTGLSKECTP